MFKNYKYKIILMLCSFFFTFPSYSNNISKINDNFLILIEKEFLNNKIKTKTQSDQKNFSILDLNKIEYNISFKLVKKNINQDWLFIPTLKVTSKSSNVSHSLARSLTFEKDANLLEIEAIAKMLVNSSVNQMKKNGLRFNITDQQFNDNTEKKLNINLNYFNSCESNQIIEIMEKEFPGFIHLETEGLNTASKTQIAYFTTSTKYKIKKWIELTMHEFGFNSKDFFIKIYKSKIDINKINKSMYIYVCE
mgnify:FL=1|jgi:hypothetical protein|tara:strand:- start:5399 stop:6148 length:750 start_codon:yes stop_codon:yes gene_type:complete